MVNREPSVGRIFPIIENFFRRDIWHPRWERSPRWQWVFIRVLRALSVAVTEFVSDQCMLRASALTFYTLLSVVPVFAIVFGIAQGFGLDKMLEKELMEQMAGQEQALERILAFSRNMLQNTKGGLIAGVGVVVMFWSAIKVLGQIEAALNAMWDVRKPRSWGRRFSDYLAVMLIAPILFLMAGSASVFIRTQFDALVARFEIVGLLGPLVFNALKLTPIVLVWALFALIYMAMPNTRVKFGAAAAGAVVGGLLYQLVQWIYIDLQVGAAKQSAIYGSFAALPLFLAWVQTSWSIVLFGAELCYALQYSGRYDRPVGSSALSLAEAKLIGLYVARLIVQRFSAGDPPLTVRGLAHATHLPLRWVQQVVGGLAEGHILSETSGSSADEPALQPAMDLQFLTLQRVSEALDSVGSADACWILPSNENVAGIRDALQRLSQAAAESPANRLLKDI